MHAGHSTYVISCQPHIHSYLTQMLLLSFYKSTEGSNKPPKTVLLVDKRCDWDWSPVSAGGVPVFLASLFLVLIPLLHPSDYFPGLKQISRRGGQASFQQGVESLFHYETGGVPFE